MSDFKAFSKAVAAQLAALSQMELYTVKVTGDEMYAAYLAAFPEGTNPIFRERTEHDCSCCRNFIKHIGNVVAVVNGELKTVWDLTTTFDNAYGVVSKALQALVRGSEIQTIFRSKERSYGAENSKELMDSEPGRKTMVRVWNHFHGTVATRHYTQDVGTKTGEFTAMVQVFSRGLKELTLDALQTVGTMIADKQLYRGDEFLAAVAGFTKLHLQYHALTTDAERSRFIMTNAQSNFSRFRNTAIGTLVQDLSEGMEEDKAAEQFGKKLDPTNYKRPTSMITPGMKKQALVTIAELGLEDSLVRRLANIHDVSINNVLWADGSVKPVMKDGIAGIMDSIATPAALVEKKPAMDVTIADFLANILPQAKGVSMLVKNRHLSNLMAITAPVHIVEDKPTSKLFKWDNDFAWTYVGNISDSIKERVKAAGGATDAVMRVSLAWNNKDDLDIHAWEPNSHRIYFGNKGQRSPGNKGMLDVDMNAGSTTPNPVENITWDSPQDGVYKIDVNNYNLREKSDVGFTLEVENNGQVHQFSSQQSPVNKGMLQALELTVKNQIITGIKIVSKGITGGSFSQQKWGVATEQYTRVNTVMLSPNHWDDNAVGNLHYMFILDGCKTDEPLRGILNEYLNAKLEPHRKVFEVLGDKTKCQPTDEQLAGLGFSSTKGDSVTVQVTTANAQRTYNIIF
jgi:hypothetical protein